MGLWAVFLTGLVTSLHCVAMCGSFVLTFAITGKKNGQTKLSAFFPHLIYNSTRMISYFAVGLAAGFLGSAVDLGSYKGLVSIVAGVLMVLLALNMLNVHPWLRFLSFRLPRRLTDKVFSSAEQADAFAPAIFGLFSGLMPCGPLQAMVLYAAGSGSPGRGGLIMLLFGLGTVPLLLAYGTVASSLAKRFSKQLAVIGALIIIILGLATVNRGLVLVGFKYNFSYAAQQVTKLFVPDPPVTAVPRDVKTQNVTIHTIDGYVPNTITVKRSVPVRLTIINPGNDMCTESIVFPSEGIDKKLRPYGTTVITFIPKKGGTFVFSSGCGMWQGTLVVTPD